MQLREPKRKKFSPLLPPQAVPPRQFLGNLNGFSVIVEATQEARNFLSISCYGKPNLSKGYGCMNKRVEIVRKRQFEARKLLFNKQNKAEKVIVMPDSDSDDDDYFKKEIKPAYEIDTSGVKEKIYLDLVEAYFLHNYKQCLAVQQNGVLLNTQQCWERFSASDKYFAQNYVCYQHFKKKNWVVKPALKFGGDYLLYKDGPAYYHASYVVIVDVLDGESLERRRDLCRRSMNTRDIAGLNRLCETTGKELLIFQILWPTNDDIKNVKVKEILMRRWDPNSKQLNN